MKLARRIATALDEVSRVAGKLADRLDPPRAVLDRAVVADGYAQGRADLQLVHDRHVEWTDRCRTRLLRARPEQS